MKQVGNINPPRSLLFIHSLITISQVEGIIIRKETLYGNGTAEFDLQAFWCRPILALELFSVVFIQHHKCIILCKYVNAVQNSEKKAIFVVKSQSKSCLFWSPWLHNLVDNISSIFFRKEECDVTKLQTLSFETFFVLSRWIQIRHLIVYKLVNRYINHNRKL